MQTRSFKNWAILGATIAALSACAEEPAQEPEEAPLTVADLQAQGVTALGNAELQTLIVGNIIAVRHRGTGQEFRATYHDDGWRTVQNLSEEETAAAIAGAFHGGPAYDVLARYEILGDRLVTSFGNKTFEVAVFPFEESFVAARSDDGGVVNWDLIEIQQVDREILFSGPSLRSVGIYGLRTNAIREIIIDNRLIVRNLPSGEMYEVTFNSDGTRTVHTLTENFVRLSAAAAFHGGVAKANTAPFEIYNGIVLTQIDGREFAITIYRVEGRLLAIRSGESSVANWEIEVIG